MKLAPANRIVLFCLLMMAGTIWDIWTKHVVFRDLGYPYGIAQPVAGEHEIFEPEHLVEGRSIDYLTAPPIGFQLTTSFNEGALWGIGQGYTWLFASLSFVAITGVVLWLFVFGAAESKWLTVALGFISAGTLGNLWDRLALHGCEINGRTMYAVRDFLDFQLGTYHWPIFNFADVFLVTGAIMLVIHSFFADMEERKSQHETEGNSVAADEAAPSSGSNEQGDDSSPDAEKLQTSA